ncbi:hypothetical protein ACFQ08_03490 [Streptosporangium algeriense]|uniref:Uncharacterized protein n=1 Tax=Streptosporangium algeriense TaxID=1682748 RepID=A0ABW3DI94_9ACTN
MTPGEQHERFDHLVRLGRAMHALGVCVVLVLPTAGEPVLEVRSASGTLVRIIVIWRSGWAFTWRPWWARIWPGDKWVAAHADNAADVIVAEVGV